MTHIAITNTNQCSCDCADKCMIDDRTGSSTRCTKQEIETKGFKTVKVDAFMFGSNDILVVMAPPKPGKTNWLNRLIKR